MKTYTIKNKDLEISCLSYGAAMMELIVKNRNQEKINVIYGYKNPDFYKFNAPYLGASVGRYAGRIGGEQFELNGETYPVFNKDGVHLHGGEEGFSFKEWTLEKIEEGENPCMILSYLSKDTEEGYPGNLEVKVTYRLLENRLHIEYEAVSDADTLVNLTNHNYYNMNGKGTIKDQYLTLDSEHFLEVNPKQIPTGKLLKSEGTPFGFKVARKIGDHPGFKGIDDCFELGSEEVSATLYSEESGIEMKVSTNQPGVVIYTPEKLPETAYLNPQPGEFPAICFETQNFPDAIHHKNFPNAILKKGERYFNKTVFEFNIR